MIKFSYHNNVSSSLPEHSHRRLYFNDCFYMLLPHFFIPLSCKRSFHKSLNLGGSHIIFLHNISISDFMNEIGLVLDKKLSCGSSFPKLQNSFRLKSISLCSCHRFCTNTIIQLCPFQQFSLSSFLIYLISQHNKSLLTF